MSKTALPSTLDIARRLLTSKVVTKAEAPPAGGDPRAEGASPTPEELAAAKQEAQAGAAAGGDEGGDQGGAPGAGAGDGDGDEGAGAGTGDGDGDESGMADKQEVAKAIVQLMESSDLDWESVAMLTAGADPGPSGHPLSPIAKSSGAESFSGGERMPGNPASDFAPGAAERQLDEILATLNKQNEVQKDLKAQLEALVTERGELVGEVKKAQETIEGLQGQIGSLTARLEAAEATGSTIQQALGALPRVAAPMAPKAAVMKAEAPGAQLYPVVGGQQIPYRTHQELMKACMEGKVDPTLAPAYTRALTAFLATPSH